MAAGLTTRRSTALGWTVLGIVVAILPVEMGWYLLKGSEPYPALTQPPFNIVPGVDEVLNGQSTSLFVVKTDGSMVEISPKSVFADSKNQRPHVIDALIAARDLDTTSRHAVRDELGKFVPVQDIAGLRIETQRRGYRPDTNMRKPTSAVHRVDIDLTGAPR